MENISNREQANRYYKKINNALDDFESETKARPSELHRYLSKNKNTFLKRLELEDVVGIENVLNDVLLHRRNLEEDKIITFEKFSLQENEIDYIGSPSLGHEKFLADFYNTSLGHIDLVDPQLHLYKVNDFGNVFSVIIFSDEELLKYKTILESKMIKNILGKQVKIGEVGGISFDSVTFYLEDFVDVSKLEGFVNSKVSRSFVISYLSNLVSNFYFKNYDSVGSKLKLKELGGFVFWSDLS